MFSSPLFIYLATVIPPIILGIIIWKSDKFPEPNKVIYKVFYWGCLICVPAYFLNTWLFTLWWQETRVSEAIISSFLTAALVEEGLKFSVLYFLVYRLKEFNEPMDAIVYGVTVSLGFATLENIYYVFHKNVSDAMIVAILRAFTAIPGHAMDGVIMGYFFGRYVFVNKNKLFYAFLFPYLLHSIYNFLTFSETLLPVFTIVFFGWFIALYLLNIQKKLQQKKTKEYQKKK